jgi:hypothetical protein
LINVGEGIGLSRLGLEGLLSGNMMMGFIEVLLIEFFLEHLVVLPLCWGFFCLHFAMNLFV